MHHGEVVHLLSVSMRKALRILSCFICLCRFTESLFHICSNSNDRNFLDVLFDRTRAEKNRWYFIEINSSATKSINRREYYDGVRRNK